MPALPCKNLTSRPGLLPLCRTCQLLLTSLCGSYEWNGISAAMSPHEMAPPSEPRPRRTKKSHCPASEDKENGPPVGDSLAALENAKDKTLKSTDSSADSEKDTVACTTTSPLLVLLGQQPGWVRGLAQALLCLPAEVIASLPPPRDGLQSEVAARVAVA